MVFFMPKEIKCGEGRFSGIPAHIFEYARAEAKVYIEKGAGEKSGFPDWVYSNYNARIIKNELTDLASKLGVPPILGIDENHHLFILKVKETILQEERWM